jgi:CspA family cold shock protein
VVSTTTTSKPPSRNFGYAPPSGPQFEAPSGLSAHAVVKWYNPDKGFGFAELVDGSGDAFLHASVLERGGHGAVLPPGATPNLDRRNRSRLRAET